MSLYNRFRPMSWDAVIGQDGISETLKNAIASGEVSSTYLFHGPRGTGKTTCARIFAKALNCENPIAPGAPCAKCDNCQDIANDCSPYVTELDAATNTGVDSMRELKSSANMITGGCGWRVYIIDECHMLSKSAQNSALKLFEESPEKTVFILCTTELHKVEGTIISRSLRFDFRPIGIIDIVGRLKHIADSEEIESDESALKAIAKAARGSMRDSISILERVSVENVKKINMTSVVRSLGITPVEIMIKLGDIIKGDFKKGFEVAGQIIADGYDIHTFLQGAVDYFRDLLMVELGIMEGLMVEKELLDDLIEVAGVVEIDTITHAIEVLDESVSKYRYNDNKQILVEMLLYKIAKGREKVLVADSPENVTPVQAQPNPQPVVQQPISLPDTINSVPMGALIDAQVSPVVNQQPQGQMPQSDYDRVCQGWQIYLMKLAEVDKNASLWLHGGHPLSFNYDELIVEFPSDVSYNVKIFNERFTSSSSKVLSGLMDKMVSVKAVVAVSADGGGYVADTVDSVTYVQDEQAQVPPVMQNQFQGQENVQPQANTAVHSDVVDQGNVSVVLPQVEQTQSVSQGVKASNDPNAPPVTPDFLKSQFGDGSSR